MDKFNLPKGIPSLKPVATESGPAPMKPISAGAGVNPMYLADIDNLKRKMHKILNIRAMGKANVKAAEEPQHQEKLQSFDDGGLVDGLKQDDIDLLPPEQKAEILGARRKQLYDAIPQELRDLPKYRNTLNQADADVENANRRVLEKQYPTAEEQYLQGMIDKDTMRNIQLRKQELTPKDDIVPQKVNDSKDLKEVKPEDFQKMNYLRMLEAKKTPALNNPTLEQYKKDAASTDMSDPAAIEQLKAKYKHLFE